MKQNKYNVGDIFICLINIKDQTLTGDFGVILDIDEIYPMYKVLWTDTKESNFIRKEHLDNWLTETNKYLYIPKNKQ